MAPHSSTLAWKIPWTEDPGRLQSMGSWKVGHYWVTSLSLSCIGEGNGNPLQCSCLENPRDGGAWWAAVYGVTQSRTWLKWLSSSSKEYMESTYKHEWVRYGSIRFKKLYFIYLFIFYFTILYWFCHTSTWIRHGCTRVSSAHKHYQEFIKYSEPLWYSEMKISSIFAHNRLQLVGTYYVIHRNRVVANISHCSLLIFFPSKQEFVGSSTVEISENVTTCKPEGGGKFFLWFCQAEPPRNW